MLYVPIYWDGQEPGDPGVQRRAELAIHQAVHDLWNEGKLPYRDGKQWVVGFEVWVSFISYSSKPIRVGPGKPHKFREAFSKIHTF